MKGKGALQDQRDGGGAHRLTGARSFASILDREADGVKELSGREPGKKE